MDQNEERTFIDDLIDAAIKKEASIHASHCDIILMDIANCESEIQKNIQLSEEEKKIIDDFTLRKNAKLQDRVEFLSRQLEQYLKDQGPDIRTVDLPHGKIMRRKSPDKIEITDLEKFLETADTSLLKFQPETVMPDLNKIKAYYKRRLILPEFTKLIVGEDKYSIKIKQNGEEINAKQQKETKSGTGEANSYRDVI